MIWCLKRIFRSLLLLENVALSNHYCLTSQYTFSIVHLGTNNLHSTCCYFCELERLNMLQTFPAFTIKQQRFTRCTAYSLFLVSKLLQVIFFMTLAKSSAAISLSTQLCVGRRLLFKNNFLNSSSLLL